jgi:ABC-type nitrate/sulfonate/bicarbonate transport system permease component
VFGAFWPILLNTIDGVRGADPLLVEVARIYRLRQPEIAWKIVLPMALPQIVAGLRLAVSVSLLATVVGEMLGGTDGLGFLILIAQRTFEYPEMYSGILMLGLLGITANGMFRILERYALHWHGSVRHAASF